MAITRRQVLKLTLAAAGLGITHSNQALASVNKVDTGVHSLIQALRSTGNSACLAMATKLTSLPDKNDFYDLHLRSAGLTLQDAQYIATALNSAKVRSFSVSYNPALTDEGAALIANNLPLSVTEVGLVGCELGDHAGKALLKWVEQAPALTMICIEGNLFSETMKNQFSSIGRTKRQLVVIV